ncbi:MAG: TIR domain-containing protein, partial [Actinobacteria bacterium]|nr:TIR domain-containing protein [Actinomycetota bacterium]
VEHDTGGQHDVFISYSRKDIAFVRILHGMLRERGLDTWIDWQDIPPSADWMAEVYRAIESANAFIFVVSETSAGSDVCRLEIAHAVKHNKRLIPITVHDVDATSLPPEVAARNWVFFRDEDDIQESFDKMLKAVETDLEWVKTHTALLQRAIEWDEHAREVGFLLRGAALADALSELAEASTGREPALTQLQAQYVEDSRKAEVEQERRWRRRTQVIRAVISGALVVSMALAAWALLNAAEARRQQRLARSNELVAYSREMVGRDPLMSFLLARSALDVDPTLAAQSALWEPLLYPFTLTSMTGHTEPLTDLALSPDGKTMVTTAWDGTARVWDVATGEETFTLASEEGHQLRVIGYAEFTPDGRFVGTMTNFINAAGGSVACLWDVTTGELVRTIPHNDFSFGSPLISPDGKLIVTCGTGEFGDWKNRLVVVDAVTGGELRGLEGLNDLPAAACFSPDGTLVAAGCIDGSIVAWDVATGAEVLRIERHSDAVSGVSFSADGGSLITASADTTVRLWDVATGRELGSADLGSEAGRVCVSSDGTRLAVKRDPGEIVVLDARTLAPVFVVTTSSATGSAVAASKDFAFSPDGLLLISAASDGSAQVNDARQGGLVLSLRGHTGTVTAARFSADGKFAVTGSEDETARVWDLKAGQEIAVIQPPSSPPYSSSLESAMLSSDGTRVVITTADGGCEVCDASNGETLYAISDISEAYDPLASYETRELRDPSDHVRSATFSPDGALLLTVADEGPPRLWDAQTGEEVRELYYYSDKSLDACVFSPDGSVIAAAEGVNGAYGVHIWSVETGEELRVIPFGSPDLGSATRVRDLDLSRDGAHLAVVFQTDTTVWDVSTGEKVATLPHGSEADWVKFSPDGRVLFDGIAMREVVTVAWDWATEQRLYTLEGAAPVDFTADGARMVTSDDDDVVRIRDVTTGETISAMSWPVAPVGAVFSPDDDRVAVGYADGEVKTWDVASAKVQHSFVGHLEAAWPLGFTPDGTRLVSYAWRDSVRVWPADYREMLRLIDEGFRGTIRGLTAEERAEYGFAEKE